MPANAGDLADRAVARARKSMMEHLPDDVIGRLGDSHLIFGKACVIVAITILTEEKRAGQEAAGG